jgi:predicted ATPase
MTPLAESLVGAAGRLRRGMTAIVITPSLDRGWVRPIAALRTRGIASVVVTVDAAAADRIEREERRHRGETIVEPTAEAQEQRAQRARALRHALAEYELRVHSVSPGRDLAECLA